MNQHSDPADPGLEAPQRWRFSGIAFDDGDGRLRVDGRERPIQPLPLKMLRVLQAAAPRTEPPRFLRRLKSLRGLSHEEVEQVFT